MSKVRNAILYSSISHYVLKIVGFASVIIFARLLTPDELGIFAIASSISLVAGELRLLGTTNFLVREKELTEEKVRSGIGLTLLVSWPLGFSMILFAEKAAQFYSLPSLRDIFIILSIAYFLAPFTSVMSALLSRSFNYAQLTAAKFISSMVSFLVSLILVLMEYSYYGLAIGNISGVFCQLVVLIFCKPPSMFWLPSFKGIRKIIRFGLFSSITNLLQRFDATLSDIVIGKLGTAANVAIFSRGTGFTLFISQFLILGIRPVALPYLSQVNRDGSDVKKAYIKATLLLGATCWPTLFVGGIASYPAILLLFGEQWIESVPVAKIVVIWSVLRVIHTLSPSLLMAVGREGIMLLKQIAVFVTMLVGMLIGFPYGLEGVAWGLVAASIVDFLFASWTVKKATGLGLIEFVFAMRLNVALTLVCCLVAWGIDRIVDFEKFNPVYSFLLLAVIMPAVWLATVIVFNHPIKTELFKLLQPLKKKLKLGF